MAEQEPSKGTINPLESIALDSDTIADMQRGFIKKPEFFHDVTDDDQHDDFKNAIETAKNYVGFIQSAIQLVDQREDNNDFFYLTKSEYKEIEKLSRSISKYGNTPQQTIIDFLIILCCIDKIQDMKKIANVLELPELMNIEILRKPFDILAIPKLYKIAFMANALDSLIKTFNRFLPSERTETKTSDIASVISNLGGLLSGTTDMLESMSGENALGNFMSELIEGVRIPTPVIAKNPMKISPSYIGQALFGESPNSISLVDVNEVFNKKLAIFPQPVNGAGVSSFQMQNQLKFSSDTTIKEFINNIMFGGIIKAGSYKDNKIKSIVDKIKVSTGVRDDEKFKVNSADVAIPLQICISAINCGMDKTPFSTKVFQDAWQTSNYVSHMMQKTNPDFINIYRQL